MISIIVETGTINIEGGTIISNNATGVYNYSTGTIKITGGTVTSGTSSGIYNSSTGTIELGEKITEEGLANGEVPNITSPKITGATYGIKNYDGKFNFYDGSITGKISQSIDKYITDMEYGYNIIKTANVAEDGTETATLNKINIMEIEGKKTYTTIESLQNDINNLEEDCTINAIADFYMGRNDKIVVPENKNITINLNGHTITATSDNAITNNGNLKIVDTSESQTGNIRHRNLGTSNVYKNLIFNDTNGKFELESGTISVNSEYENIIFNLGSLVINGGIINLKEANNYSYENAIYNNGTGKIIINGGTINVNGYYGYGVYNNSTEKVEINNGTVNLTKYNQYGVYNRITGEINLNGGKINAYRRSWSI